MHTPQNRVSDTINTRVTLNTINGVLLRYYYSYNNNYSGLHIFPLSLLWSSIKLLAAL